MRKAIVLLALTGMFGIAGAAPTADEIMAQVAANQDRAVELRKHYVFQQRARVRITKGADKLKRDDTRYYVVTPTETGMKRTLQNREVIHRKDGEELELMGIGAVRAAEIEGIDQELADDFHEDLAGDEDSRDGLNPDLFPLTTREQAHYRFELLGEDAYQGRPVYDIRYEPEEEGWDGEPWRGEALVDRKQFQPVLVTSELAWKIPLWVRTIFGVNVRQVGFKVAYRELERGVWFPVSYGGEFRIKALHFFHRRAAISLVNSGFQRTKIDSEIHFAEGSQVK